MRVSGFVGATIAALPSLGNAYTWKSVHTGGGGGFTSGIVFNSGQKGVAYARTDIGGLYRLNSDDSWTAVTDFANSTTWHDWGIDAVATDPSNANVVYAALGEYTNSWDPNNGQIGKSTNQGSTWTFANLPFKVGGNMPGRGMGERLAIDPHNSNIIYFGARSDNGLWKSTNAGASFSQVTSFPKLSTFQANPSDATGYNNDHQGFAWITFDSTSTLTNGATSRIFAGVAINTTSSLYVSNDAGSTWSALTGQPKQGFLPHKGKLSPAEHALYISYSDGSGPYDGTNGSVWRYQTTDSTWKDISPTTESTTYYGYGGLAVDYQKPGTIMVASLNSWYPDAIIFRSNNSVGSAMGISKPGLISNRASWTPVWSWADYPNENFYYSMNNQNAPWISNVHSVSVKTVGWMIEALEIDPFDSNHWLYGTGESLYGGHDLLNWDTKHNVSISVLASGIEETSVQDLIVPPGQSLVSSMGDIAGFKHTSLTTAPGATLPFYGTTTSLDYAGNTPKTQVLIGNSADGTTIQIANSYDAGVTWSQNYAASTSPAAGHAALSASATSILWSTGSSGVQVSKNSGSFQTTTGLSQGALVASDKRNDTVFYGSSSGGIAVSTNGGSTFGAAVKLGSSSTVNKIVANPTVAGDLWASTDTGLFHSTNYGKTFNATVGPTAGYAFALGTSTKNTYKYNIFGFFTVKGVTALFESQDIGATWTMISDATHGFGSASSNPVAASQDTEGLVFVGTNGRGVFYGTP